MQASRDAPALSTSWNQSSREGPNALGSASPKAVGLAPAGVVALQASDKYLKRQFRFLRCRHEIVWNLYRPDRPLNTAEFFKSRYTLMAKKLGPGSVRRICQIMRWTLPWPVPPSGRLIICLPEKRETRRGVTVKDHVAGEPVSAQARARTCCGPGSPGFHSPLRSRAGLRPPSWTRFLSNHCRIPISL